MTLPSALILDRDGTLNAMVCNPQGDQDSPYFARQLEYYPHLLSLLKPWADSTIPFFIVTNQPGIAKGNFTRQDLREAHDALRSFFLTGGISIQDIFSCIHHPVGAPEGDSSLIGPCECRKPKPGMFFDLQKKHQIDLSRAIYIGDSQVDREAAEQAGIGTFRLVRTFVSARVPEGKRVIAFPNAPTLAEVLGELRASS